MSRRKRVQESTSNGNKIAISLVLRTMIRFGRRILVWVALHELLFFTINSFCFKNIRKIKAKLSFKTDHKNPKSHITTTCSSSPISPNMAQTSHHFARSHHRQISTDRQNWQTRRPSTWSVTESSKLSRWLAHQPSIQVKPRHGRRWFAHVDKWAA